MARLFNLLGFTKFTLCIAAHLLFVGCTSSPLPVNTPSVTINHTSAVALETEPGQPPTALPSESPSALNPNQILELAVTNLVDADSFEMISHEIRAYQAVAPDGETQDIYGEFKTHYSVIRSPALQVVSTFEYRFDPQSDFVIGQSYVYQEDDLFFIQLFDSSNPDTVQEIDPGKIAPFAEDVYQTLTTYFDRARFVGEREGLYVYVLEHPEWYRLNGAIGFADLGFLYGQQDGERLVEQYVADQYPNVETIVFTIYVSVEEMSVTKVEVDDSAFMSSVWAEVDRALLEQGAEPADFTQFQVKPENGAEHLFGQFNLVQDLPIPE